MTAEQRMDRLERIARLFVTAGLRVRRNMRELDEKIGILVDAQIANEERFAALARSQEQTNQKFVDLRIASEERFGALAASHQETNQKLTEVRIASEERFAALAESQRQSEQKLAALIDIISKQTNGKH